MFNVNITQNKKIFFPKNDFLPFLIKIKKMFLAERRNDSLFYSKREVPTVLYWEGRGK